MINFLFWNLNKKPLADAVLQIVKQHSVDVIILTETQSINLYTLLEHLNQKRSEYHFAASKCERIKIFTRFSESFIGSIYDSSSTTTIRHIKLPARTDILLVALHLQSKLHQSDDSQNQALTKLSQIIRECEEKIGHRRTVLVGDLNMSPFESGIVGALGLHAVMSKEVTKSLTRVIDKVEYPFFYNPMWNLLGDHTPGPPGTYYYRRAEYICYHWNLFDQVLVRPELQDKFDNSSLIIIDSFGEERLLDSQGRPNKKDFSDHLPLFFRLSL